MDMFHDYDNYDAVGLSELIAAGEVTSLELIETAIQRAEMLNPSLNAIVAKHYERARRQAARSDHPGPFHGVPFLTKDLAMVKGDIASFGSVFFRDYRPDYTDEFQRRVQAAGLISIGRTNSPEFGLLPTTESNLHGSTKNPWDTSRSSGGSSGGSAAATAAGIVPMAHSSDGGGSIRIPASACGVFGFKPSRGRMPRYPGSAADYLSLDLCVSRSVRDSATLLDVTHGAVPGAGYHAPAPTGAFAAAATRDPRRLKIAHASVDFRGQATDPDCVEAVAAAASHLAALGHVVVDAKPEVDGQSMAEAFMVVWESLAESIFAIILAEASKQTAGSILRRSLGDRRAMRVIARLDQRKSGRAAFEPFTWGLARRSQRRTPAQLEAAKAELQRVSYVVAAFMEEHDVFLTPVLGSPPVLLGEIDQTAPWEEVVEGLMRYVAFTPVANFAGLPAMSVPTHWSSAGLPIGTHFMGRFGEEELLYSLAGQLERTLPWVDRRPAQPSILA